MFFRLQLAGRLPRDQPDMDQNRSAKSLKVLIDVTLAIFTDYSNTFRKTTFFNTLGGKLKDLTEYNTDNYLIPQCMLRNDDVNTTAANPITYTDVIDGSTEGTV